MLEELPETAGVVPEKPECRKRLEWLDNSRMLISERRIRSAHAACALVGAGRRQTPH